MIILKKFNDFTVGIKVAVAPIITSNRLKALSVTSKKGGVESPLIPKMVLTGFPENATGSWYGLLAPAGSPTDIILKSIVLLMGFYKIPCQKSPPKGRC